MSLWIAALLIGQVPQAPAADAPPDRGSVFSLIDILLPPKPGPADEAELAGGAKGARVVVLTWERAYGLAYAGRPVTGAIDEPRLDALAEEFKRTDVGTFLDRWRKGPAAGGFRDPAPEMIAAWTLRARLDSALRQRAILTHAGRVFAELLKGEGAGLTPIDLDTVTSRAEDERLAFETLQTQYIRALGALKRAVGLPVTALVIPDPSQLDPFRSIFTAFEDWQRDPKRRLAALSTFAARLPSAPVLSAADRDAVARLLGLADANDPSITRLGGPDAYLDFIASCRQFATLSDAQRVAAARLVLDVRRRSNALEEFIAPTGTAERKLDVAHVDADLRIGPTRDRLVGGWHDLLRERLKIQRALGHLPGDDPAGFLASLKPIAGPSADTPGPPPVPPAPAAPSPPPPR